MQMCTETSEIPMWMGSEMGAHCWSIQEIKEARG